MPSCSVGQHGAWAMLVVPYLAGADVVQAVDTAGRRADLNPAVMTKTDASIPAVRRISFMRVRAAMQPTGVWLTPEALNVPGQRFQGTVTNNRVEGVFEIAHPRYDGARAPALPADFSKNPALMAAVSCLFVAMAYGFWRMYLALPHPALQCTDQPAAFEPMDEL